ncbi:hypothetical protein HIMB59_00013960 [alpha proteobacterium HIMB59]|nr:hypothetical protein HIMB59_00013960 [alpha proteobacterium HIMB59]
MVDKKLDVVSSFLKDNFLSTFLLIFFSFFTLSCERSFQDFDKNLLEKKKELEEFNEKSNIRKEEILKSQNEQN